MSNELRMFLADNGIETIEQLQSELDKIKINIAVFTEEIK